MVIHQFAETRGIEPDGQGVDREVPAAEVFPDGTSSYPRERGRSVIRFGSSRGYVEGVPVRERDSGRAEAFMGRDASLVLLGEVLGKTNPMAFDDQVEINVRDAKEKIPDKPAYGIQVDVTSLGEFTGLL